MKKCLNCKKLKYFDSFSRNKKRKDGLYVYCRKCVSEKYKKWYKKWSKENVRTPIRLKIKKKCLICKILFRPWEKKVKYCSNKLLELKL